MSESESAKALRRRKAWVAAPAAALGLCIAGLLGRAAVHNGLTQPEATVITGAGAVIAAVLVYANGARSRSQDRIHHLDKRSAEQTAALHDRYVTVAKFLGDGSVAVRQAGAHALAQLADDWDAHGHPEQKQVCLDLMHNYLRGPVPVPTVTDPNPRGEGEVRRVILRDLLDRSPSLRDLRNVDLSGVWLQGVGLAGFDLTQAKLVGARLRYVSLDKARMDGADLSGATLELVEFDGAFMDGVSFRGAKLYEVGLCNTYLADADFTDAILADVELENAQVTGAIFAEADMPDVTLTQEQLLDVR